MSLARRLAKAPSVDLKFDNIRLRGGLDLHTPQTDVAPGTFRDALNFECSINGGYTRIPGYERYDGRASPTGAVYVALTVNITGGLAVGNSVNGQTSGATGVVAAIDGSTVILTKVTGTFAVENLRIISVVVGNITNAAPLILDATLRATYQLAASNILRLDIAAVPGAGPVLGVFLFESTLYAFRNNVGNTAAILHRESAGGWVPVAMPYQVDFTAGGGGSAPAVGATLTQGGVTAVIRKVVTRVGTWSGTAVGKLVIDLPSGGSFAAGAATSGASTLTLSGAHTQISFLPGGSFKFDIGNAGKGERVYGVDGVNKAFEFDGTYVTPITTGMTSDTPSRVKVHRKHLFLAFGPSAQNSGIGDAYAWSVVTGANELLVRQDINDFLVLPGNETTGSMAIISNDGMAILYGKSNADWNLAEFNYGVGGKGRSAQAIGQGYMFDDLGIVALPAVQQFGNFAATSLTTNIRSFTQQRRTLVTDSLINREKSQYRLYFSDGYALYATVVNNRFIGATPIYFPNAVSCACNGESTNGGEVSYFGSTNGFVYRMDIGTSFDGAAIEARGVLAFAAQGNPQIRKDYRRAVFELQGEGYAEFDIGQFLSYGDQEVDQATGVVDAAGVYWDQFTWDNFYWDGRTISPTYSRLEGVAENISIAFSQNSALWPSYTINNLILHYIPRRVVRH